MAWLGGLLVSLFGSVLTYFAERLTKKTALIVTALAVFLGLTTAFVFAVKALLLAGMVYGLPGWLGSAAGAIVPSNLPACVAAYVAARLVRWVYDYHVQTLKIASYIT